ncbi:caspase b-like [Thunnus albacares]|uniref:caspase b-like n=1 Tax=Thunnus albacares TaxID=8236 RepID=UPI001CF71C39|nr:caspase b-like [Thunnus albacares]
MPVPQLLLEILEDLRDDDFKKFKFYLTTHVLDSCRPIPKSRLEKASWTDTVTEMIQTYSDESSVNITVEILKKIYNNNAAEKLKETYAEERAATPSTSSSALAPPVAAPAATSAQSGMFIINGSVTILKPTQFHSP